MPNNERPGKQKPPPSPPYSPQTDNHPTAAAPSTKVFVRAPISQTGVAAGMAVADRDATPQCPHFAFGRDEEEQDRPRLGVQKAVVTGMLTLFTMPPLVAVTVT